jgi:structural maintenance of chromosome 4
MEILDEYKKKLEVYLGRARDLDLVVEKRNQAKEILDTLMKERLAEFMAGFSAISMKLKEMYQVNLVRKIHLSE